MITEHTTITINITPRLLRAIASNIESAMDMAKVGQKVPSHTFYGNGLDVELIADQDIYENHKRGNFDSWT